MEAVSPAEGSKRASEVETCIKKQWLTLCIDKSSITAEHMISANLSNTETQKWHFLYSLKVSPVKMEID